MQTADFSEHLKWFSRAVPKANHDSLVLHHPQASTEPKPLFFLFRETNFIPFNQEVPGDNFKGACFQDKPRYVAEN